MVAGKMSSRARNYFEELKQGGAAGLRKLVEEKRPVFEGDWLEYKSGDDLNNYLAASGQGSERVKEKLKEEWSKCLSAFANNEGGVVIFGIHAVTRDGIDAPDAERLLPDVVRAESTLRTLTDKLTDPPLSGVEFQPMPIEGTTEGFLVAFIPEGQIKPYRAESTLRRFYYRSGTSSNVATVSTVRMLFATSKRYTAGLQGAMRSLTPTAFQCEFAITNTSLYTMRNPLVRVSIQDSPQFRFHQGQDSEVQYRDGSILHRPHAPINNRDSARFTCLVGNLSGGGKLTLLITLSIEDSYPLCCIIDLLPDGPVVADTMLLYDLEES